MPLRRMLKVCFVGILLNFALPSAALAYLDPGTGSYVFQLALAAIVGLGFLVKVYWKKIKAFLRTVVSRLTRQAQPHGEKDGTS